MEASFPDRISRPRRSPDHSHFRRWSDFGSRNPGPHRRAAAAVREVHVVDLVSRLLEQDERAGHHELDVVRVRRYGECDLGQAVRASPRNVAAGYSWP